MWMELAKVGIGFLQKKSDADYQRKWDKYNNDMVALQAAQSQNTISKNVATNRSQHADNKLLIQSAKLKAAAKAKAGAAAAGVAGGSVENTIFDIGRNAGTRLMGENERFDQSLQITDAQRRGVSLQKQMATTQLTPQPSLLQDVLLSIPTILNNEQQGVSSRGTQLEGGQLPSTGGWSNIKNMLMI